MKQRFSSLDVKVIAHELQQTLVTLRVSNVYDLSSKILLLKFAKPDNKQQLIIDSGFRCHLTDFARPTADAPSAFVARLRKFLKTRRVTSVAQIGTDRIIEFQFSDGQYRLYLEFFASGNIILTDSELKILTLARPVPEGEGQEPQRVGLNYSLENRQNFNGIPALTDERLRRALQTIVEKATAANAAGKKIKRKPADELRRGLATTITEVPPLLVDHAFHETGFDGTKTPADILDNNDLFASLLKSLEEARNIVDEVTSSSVRTGYIIAKLRNGSTGDTTTTNEDPSKSLVYEDFHPFLPHQYQNNTSFKVLTFDNFNKTVDEFFSSIEGQKLESRLSEREATAKRKLDAAKKAQAGRIESLQEAQLLNVRKAAAIEANVERVQEAMDAVSGLLQQGMDWVDVGKLVEREQKRYNPVAEVIKLPLKLSENIITLIIGEEVDEEADDADSAYETDSTASESEDIVTEKSVDKRLEVDVNLGLSPWVNAREYYDQKRTAVVKEHKTIQQSSIALKNAQQKIASDLRKGLKQEKPILQPIRKQMWFEKFYWFISSDGYLVLGGRDAQQNETLYKRYLRKGDIYIHADLHGAPSIVIKNDPKTPDAPVPPSTLSQAGSLAVCASNAWDSKAGMGAYWVTADQVSKSAPTGEFLPTGSFMVRGKKNFLPPAQLLLGFGVMFKISEESKAKHVKHRLQHNLEDGTINSSDDVGGEKPSEETTTVDSSQHEVEDNYESDGSKSGDDGETLPRSNPLQSSATNETLDSEPEDESIQPPSEAVAELQLEDDTAGHSQPDTVEELEGDQDQQEEGEDDPDGSEIASRATPAPDSASQAATSSMQKKGPAKRGQRGKAKKIAAKYKDQDEDDRAAVEALIGATAGRQKAEAEAKAKVEREAEMAATKERRRAQHQRQQQATKEHEEIRRVMLDEGLEVLDDAELASSTPLDSLVGTPLAGDEILEVIPVCAPWTSLVKLKYRAKMQPGAVKKGKAVNEIIRNWKEASEKKSVVDEQSRDPEKMWPREVELIKGMRPEESFNCVPVGKVRVMMSGGSGGGGSSKGGGGQGKGGRGGKGSKKR